MNSEKAVVELLASISSISNQDIALDHHLKNDLGLDSLDIVEVTMECELKFKILPNWEDENITTVRQLIKVIEEHTQILSQN